MNSMRKHSILTYYNGKYYLLSAKLCCDKICLYGMLLSRNGGFNMTDRQGIIVYVHQLKHAKSLRKYGHVHFISRKLKYVVMYCNRDELELVKTKLQRLPFVKDVVESYRPFLKTEFENAKPDKAKEYDYKVGL